MTPDVLMTVSKALDAGNASASMGKPDIGALTARKTMAEAELKAIEEAGGGAPDQQTTDRVKYLEAMIAQLTAQILQLKAEKAAEEAAKAAGTASDTPSTQRKKVDKTDDNPYKQLFKVDLSKVAEAAEAGDVEKTKDALLGIIHPLKATKLDENTTILKLMSSVAADAKAERKQSADGTPTTDNLPQTDTDQTGETSQSFGVQVSRLLDAARSGDLPAAQDAAAKLALEFDRAPRGEKTNGNTSTEDQDQASRDDGRGATPADAAATTRDLNAKRVEDAYQMLATLSRALTEAGADHP